MSLNRYMLSNSNLPASTLPASRKTAKAKCRYVSALVIVLAASPITPGWALETTDASLDQRLHQRPTVDEVARQISEKLNWRILAAEPTVEDEKVLYRFKLLDHKRGRVQVIIIDPDQMPDLTALK